jgi:hypothetical protein
MFCEFAGQKGQILQLAPAGEGDRQDRQQDCHPAQEAVLRHPTVLSIYVPFFARLTL